MSVSGILAVAVWSLYVLLAAFLYWPDFLASVLALGFVGLVAVLAVVLNFAYWRLVVILASCVYLVFYVVRVSRMLLLTAGFDVSALPSGLVLYYASSWQVTLGSIQERGAVAGLAHGYLEYAMPVLSLVLIVIVLMTRRRERGATSAR